MPDSEGYLEAGELPLGAYAALEGDLGESLMGPLGFSAAGRDEVFVDGVEVGGVRTVPGLVRYVVQAGGLL